MDRPRREPHALTDVASRERAWGMSKEPACGAGWAPSWKPPFGVE